MPSQYIQNLGKFAAAEKSICAAAAVTVVLVVAAAAAAVVAVVLGSTQGWVSVSGPRGSGKSTRVLDTGVRTVS